VSGGAARALRAAALPLAALAFVLSCLTAGAPRQAPGSAGMPPPASGRGVAPPPSEAGQAGAGAAPILAGAASRPITPAIDPARPVRIAGFGPGRDATGVHDDLSARALALEVGSQSVAIVALDLIGLFHDDVALIREAVARRGDGPAEVLVASTHTHAGPDIIGLWTPEDRSVDADYVAAVREAAAGAVAEAWASRRPARLTFAASRFPELLRDTRLPLAVDDLGLLLRVDAADGGGTIASLVNFASHPESLGRDNTLISSDYPWASRRALEEAYGGVALFLPGAVGGMMTPLGVSLIDPLTGAPAPQKSFRIAELLGEELADGLIGVLTDGPAGQQDGRGYVERAVLSVARRPLRLPLDNARLLAGLRSGRIRARRLDANGALESEAVAVTLRAAPGGEPLAQFACVPGEIYPELVIGGIQEPQDPAADLPGAPREPALRELMSAPYRFVLGLCNDEVGYIIPASQWDEAPPFAYGRDAPQYGEINSAGPRTAPIVLQAFADLFP
jgi:hypothetical protein